MILNSGKLFQHCNYINPFKNPSRSVWSFKCIFSVNFFVKANPINPVGIEGDKSCEDLHEKGITYFGEQVFVTSKHLEGRSGPRVSDVFYSTKGFCNFPVSRHFLSVFKDFVGSAVSRHFLSVFKDFVVSAVFRHL